MYSYLHKRVIFLLAAHIPGVQYRVEEREVKARMDTPAVRAVLDMGFDRSIVLNAIRKQLRQRGNYNFTTEQLVISVNSRDARIF